MAARNPSRAASGPISTSCEKSGLVVQDGMNLAPDASEANQNFKLVSWQDVLEALELAPSEGLERE